MIYMVEMTLLETARRAEWDAWYVAHQHRLLSIPGFRASQRFESIHQAESPFVALHEVDSADIFTSPTYRAKAGPTNTGEWQAKMNNWHRNLFALDHTPDVPMDARLVVVDDAGASAVPAGVPTSRSAVAGGITASPSRVTLRSSPTASIHRTDTWSGNATPLPSSTTTRRASMGTSGVWSAPNKLRCQWPIFARHSAVLLGPPFAR